MKLDNNNHSVFLLNYQLIMCTKHRNKVIDDVISNRLREMFEICLSNIISHWMNGITMPTMFIFSFEDGLIQR